MRKPFIAARLPTGGRGRASPRFSSGSHGRDRTNITRVCGSRDSREFNEKTNKNCSEKCSNDLNVLYFFFHYTFVVLAYRFYFTKKKYT